MQLVQCKTTLVREVIMPQPRVLDLAQSYEPRDTEVNKFFNKVGQVYKDREDQNTVDRLINEYKANRDNSRAWEDLQLGLEQSTISPTKRLQTQQNLNEMKKLIIEQDKALNAKFRANALTSEEREAQKQNLIKTGMPEWEAESYLDAPPGVKSRIQAYHLEQVDRGLRSPLPSEIAEAPQKQAQVDLESRQVLSPTQEPTEVPTPQSEASKEAIVSSEAPPIPQTPKPAAIVSGQDAWPVLPPPAETTAAEREKIRMDNQKTNIKTLEENHKKLRAIRDDQLAIGRMQQYNDSGDLPKGTEKWLTVNPETGDLRAIGKLSEKSNATTQAYVKEVNKFIRNAKDYYGARVTNFDLQTFLAQLPTLANTEQGRRLILKQMEQESKLQGIYANKMDKAIKHYGRNANMIDITRVVDEQIEGEEAEQIRKMNLAVEAGTIMNKMAS